MSDVAPEERRWERPPRSSGGVKRLATWLLVVGLAALAFVLLSERNENRYSLVLVDGAVVVKKGVFFPVGRRTWAPEPRLAAAYAPLQPPPGKAVEEKEAQGLDGLDRELYDLLAAWAKEEIASADPKRLVRGIEYVGRAELLQGLSAAQRADLDALRAEAGFFEGRRLVGDAAEGLRRARERLGRTAASSSGHAGDAGEAVRDLDQALEALGRATDALGRAGPAKEPPAPQPAAAPPQ